MKSSAVASVNTIKINSKQRWHLIKYDDILGEVKTKAENFRSTAKEYVPKLYEALHNENPYIPPHNARERIEKDLVGIWSKRTILDALPDEAKAKSWQIKPKGAQFCCIFCSNNTREDKENYCRYTRKTY